jgi:hypothetical protein
MRDLRVETWLNAHKLKYTYNEALHLVRVIQRRPLALGLALVYTVGLLLAIYVTLWRAP